MTDDQDASRCPLCDHLRLEKPQIPDGVRVYIVENDGAYSARDITNEYLRAADVPLIPIIRDHRRAVAKLRKAHR